MHDFPYNGNLPPGVTDAMLDAHLAARTDCPNCDGAGWLADEDGPFRCPRCEARTDLCPECRAYECACMVCSNAACESHAEPPRRRYWNYYDHPGCEYCGSADGTLR